MLVCPLHLSLPSTFELVAIVDLDFVFLEKSILDRYVLIRKVISRAAVERKECFLILHSLATVQVFVPSSEASCPVILGIILPFFLPTLSSAEMTFGQHLALITEDLFVQGLGHKSIKKCTFLTVIRQIPFSNLCATGSFPPATF